MGKPLHVLIVEDSENDALLLLRELQRGGYEVEFERVETTEAMQAALMQKTWDLIISDYSLPEFSALQALEIMKASGLDLPFIIMSGTIGEDTAVAALKAGAHDFLVKGKFSRLGPAIERELREAETRRERRRAEQEIESLASFPEESTGPVLRFARDGRLLYANPASADLLRMWNCKVGDRPPDEIQLIVYKSLVMAPSGEIEVTHEDTIDALMFVPIIEKDYVNVYGRDITERKQAEEKTEHQLQRLKALRAIDVTISSSFDIRVTLDIVLQQVLSQLGVNAAAIVLFYPHQQTIEYAASRGFRSEAFRHAQLELSESHAGRAMRERLTIHVPDPLKSGGKLAEAMQLAQEDFVDYYGTPLITKAEVKGLLEVYHRSSLSPDPEWLGFLETLAGEAAIAIDNAQLFEGLQRAKAELEQRVAERTAELNQKNLELEHANRAKDDFLATMSHELRTPLNSILGLSGSLLEQRRGPLNDSQQKSLQTIEASGRHLLELINDILDLSKIEAGKFDYYPQLIGVDDMCHASLAFVKEQATRKSITLTYQEGLAVSKINADPRRLKQILINLLTNAVKFTPKNGQVILQVRADAEQDRIQFSVIDNGIGIALEDLRQLFVPFAQVDNSLSREYEGTGLGLALVQRLTDLHGGSVDVESEVGKGSRFTINLPWREDSVDQQKVIDAGREVLINEQAGISNIPTHALVERMTILLAEDNMANILMIGDYLESHGYQIVVAHNGLEAIEQAEQIQPNIILMDIQMPALDGLEAIRRLRALPRFTTTPIIALTALAMSGDRERCLEAGANEYISKPVSLKQLVKMIDSLTGQGE